MQQIDDALANVNAEQKSVEELLKEMKKPVTRDDNYREQSLQIHALIWTTCAREFCRNTSTC